MNKHNEKMYQATMAIARTMLKKNLINREDYRKFDDMFKEKYHPALGALLADIDTIIL